MRSNWRSAAWRSPLAACRRIEREVRDLVARVELDHRLPPAVEAQQVEVAQAQLLAPLLGPLLVAVLGQQLAAVEGERCARGSDVVVGQRPPGELLELPRRRRSTSVFGAEHDVVAAQHDRVRHVDRPPGEVRRLVQLGRRLVDGVVGPDEVDDLLAVQPPAGRQREHLHERGGVAPRPVALVDRTASTVTPNRPSIVTLIFATLVTVSPLVFASLKVS